MAGFVVLDSEAVSALANASRSPKAAKRAQAVLTSAARHQALVRTPVAVLAEVYRGHPADAAVNRVLRAAAPAVNTTARIARIAGGLLARYRRSSRDAVDALVVATAVRMGGAIIATHDVKDFRALAVDHPNIKIVGI